MSRRKKEKVIARDSKWAFLSELDPEIKKTIIAVLLLTVSLVIGFSLVGLAGGLGEKLVLLLVKLLGKGRFLLPIGLLLVSVMYFRRLKRRAYPAIWFGTILIMLGFIGLLHVFLSEETMRSAAENGSGGGYAGYLLALLAIRTVGVYAGAVILLAAVIIGILIAFNSYLAKILLKKEDENENLRLGDKGLSKGKNVSLLSGSSQINPLVKTKEESLRLLEKIRNAMSKDEGSKDAIVPAVEKSTSVLKPGSLSLGHKKNGSFGSHQSGMTQEQWKFPPTSILEKGSGRASGGDTKLNSSVIEKTLVNFGIRSEVVDINVGPTVTQYALRPAEGVRLSKITALQNDLAMSLAAHPIRIEAPIPGKSLVGIEIPNEKFAIVRLRSLLENPIFNESKGDLLIALGEDASGDYIYADIAEMPHLLVAGATGAGKSIGINTVINALLYKHSPEDLKLILIDPKRVELSLYNGIPHLLTPVIVEVDKVVNALKWTVAEMDRRYRVLQETQCRDIKGHNELVKSSQKNSATKIDVKNEDEPEEKKEENHGFLEYLPYIVVIIDELADIMVTSGKEVESLIIRIAQKARAVGIHLILSTQRPSVEIITGLIKANVPSRIAYQVASQIDSRTILDMAGAEKLLGKGDMLYLARDSGKPKRIQGAFVTEAEVKKVVDFLKKQGEPEYNDEVTQLKMAGSGNGIFDSMSQGNGGGSGSDDALFEAAKEVVISTQRASATLLQRKLKVGYARAARLIEMLEEEGTIGPYNGSKAREILVKKNSEVAYEDPIADQERRDRWQA